MKTSKKVIAAAVAAITFAAVSTYTYFTPYMVVDEIKSGFLTKNEDKIAKHVDFTSLQQSAKNTFSIVMASKAMDVDNPFEVFGMALGTGMVNSVIDRFINKEGLRTLLSKISFTEEEKSNAVRNLKDRMKLGYEGFNDFRTVLHNEDGTVIVTFVLERDGLWNWKVTDVRLSDTSLTEINGKTQPVSEPVSESELPKVSLQYSDHSADAALLSPELLKEFVGKHPQELMKNEIIRSQLNGMLGDKSEEFFGNMDVSSGVELQGDWIFGKACAAHSCGSDRAAIVVNLYTGEVFAGTTITEVVDATNVKVTAFAFGNDDEEVKKGNIPELLKAWCNEAVS